MLKFTFFKETKQVITKRLIFQNTGAEFSSGEKDTSLSQMAELDLKATKERGDLMKQMNESLNSPTLKEISLILREQSDQTGINNDGKPKYEEGQKVPLPIPGYTIYSVRENGVIKIYEENPLNPSQPKKISVIAEWLKEKGIK